MIVNEPLLKECKKVSRILKSLAHPDRLKVLCLLVDQERTVGELVESCGSSQSQVSQFLSRMRLEGLVEGDREGQVVRYRIADPNIRKLIRSLKNIYCP